MNPITMQLVADEYIRMALKEDINSEDVSTNAVMPEYRKGEVQLLAKADGIIAGLQVFERVFKLLDEATETKFEVKDGDTINVSFEGRIDGETFEGGSSDSYDGAQLFTADERHCDLYESGGEAFRRNEDDAFRYAQDDPVYAYI